MKKIFSKSLKFLSAFSLFVAINANAFSEGEDYILLQKPILTQKGTLIKIFSYACPFCYKYDKIVVPTIVKKVEGLKYEPFHLKNKANEHNEGETANKIFAVAIIKDKAKGVDLLSDDSLFKKAQMAYYEAYNDKKQRWSDAESFLDFGLQASGISKAEYEKMLDDTKVQALLEKWEQSYEIAKIRGVPAFVVNGKYLINTAKLNSIDAMCKLIQELMVK
ncbi:MAG: thiol:disulfide interchange protein DsbA/DsbL [Campylobacter sp.]|nr:thiol:disulfide interchange protein DsbA/DsbL [Campylobacter sp.]